MKDLSKKKMKRLAACSRALNPSSCLHPANARATITMDPGIWIRLFVMEEEANPLRTP